jgi:hypothetical protein
MRKQNRRIIIIPKTEPIISTIETTVDFKPEMSDTEKEPEIEVQDIVKESEIEVQEPSQDIVKESEIPVPILVPEITEIPVPILVPEITEIPVLPLQNIVSVPGLTDNTDLSFSPIIDSTTKINQEEIYDKFYDKIEVSPDTTEQTDSVEDFNDKLRKLMSDRNKKEPIVINNNSAPLTPVIVNSVTPPVTNKVTQVISSRGVIRNKRA